MADTKAGPVGTGGNGAGEHDGVNVQVLLRCRALSDKEVAERTPQVVSCNEALREVTLFQTAGGKQLSRTFRFDKVFGPDAAQEKLFKQAITPIVDEVLDGFNCTIFAYGQTGTGKTYTMEGGPRQSDDGRSLSAAAGVIPRSIKQIFDSLEANSSDSTVKVSFMELYNEEVTDLMSFDDARDTSAGPIDRSAATSATTADGKARLRLLEDKGGVVVQGLEEVIVRSAAEIYQVLDRGTAKRRTAETKLNSRSSRSHSVFTITIHMKETTPEGEDVVKVGKLNLVDLAGSENISRSGAKDGRAREAGSINQSLLTLGRVITALVEHSGHVPYRDSKLTRLLRDSLGGRTKTCIIATIAPTVQCQEETISTLDYAHRAKNIRNRPEVNQKISKTTMIKELATEIEKLKLDLIATREKNGVYLSADRFEQSELERAHLKESVRAQRAEMEMEEANHTAALTAATTAAAAQLEALTARHAAAIALLEASLAAKEEELVGALDRLTDANVALQEQRFVMGAQRRAEHALAVHGQELAGELTAASADLSALFARLDNVTSMQTADRQGLQDMHRHVTERLSAISNSVADALSGQGAQLSTAAANAAALRRAQDTAAASLSEQLAAMSAQVAELTSAIGGAVVGGCAAASTAATSAQGAADKAISGAAAAAAAAQGAAAAAIASLVTALQQQAAALVADAEQRLAESTEAAAALRTAGEASASRLAAVRSTAASLQAGVTSSYSSAGQGLTTLADSFQAGMAAQQRELMERIGGLVNAFAAERSGAVTAAVQGLSTRLASDSTAAATGFDCLMSGMDSTLVDLTTVQQQATRHLQGAGAAAQASAVTIAGDLQVAAEGGTTAAAAADAAGQRAAAMLASQAATVSEAHSTLAKALEGCKTAAGAAALVASEQLVSAGMAASGVLSGHHAESSQLLTQLDAAVAAAASAATTLGQQHAGAVTALDGKLGEQVQRRLTEVLPPPPSAFVQRRTVCVPAADAVQVLLCPPEEVLLTQYRRGRTQMLGRRGGEQRWAAPESPASAAAPTSSSFPDVSPAHSSVSSSQENTGSAARGPTSTNKGSFTSSLGSGSVGKPSMLQTSGGLNSISGATGGGGGSHHASSPPRSGAKAMTHQQQQLQPRSKIPGPGHQASPVAVGKGSGIGHGTTGGGGGILGRAQGLLVDRTNRPDENGL